MFFLTCKAYCFSGILPKEKPSEIKTVRIVKRQSERRSRERDKKKVSYDEQSSAWVNEEPDLSSDDYLETDEGKWNVKCIIYWTIKCNTIIDNKNWRLHTSSISKMQKCYIFLIYLSDLLVIITGYKRVAFLRNFELKKDKYNVKCLIQPLYYDTIPKHVRMSKLT